MRTIKLWCKDMPSLLKDEFKRRHYYEFPFLIFFGIPVAIIVSLILTIPYLIWDIMEDDL